MPNPAQSPNRRALSWAIRHLELILTGAGLAVILAVPQCFPATARVMAAAVTATLVGVVHGLIFWSVRRRQRQMRAALVADLQSMLKDRINNRLQVVLLNAGESSSDMRADDRTRLDEIATAVREVSQLLDVISLESLSAWQSRYPHIRRAEVAS